MIQLEAVDVQEDEENQTGPPAHANNPNHAWRGVAPAAIKDKKNPTLELVAGQEHTIKWTNKDGDPHNFVIEDANGKKLLKSKVRPKKGATQTVTFTATEEMAEYYCQPHKHDMRGTIKARAASASFSVSDLNPTKLTVEQGDSLDVSATITNTGGIEGTQEITLVIDGETVASQDLTLAADDSTTVTFKGIDTSGLDPGEYTHTVATEDNEASGTLIVEENIPWNRDLDVSRNPKKATNWDNYNVSTVLARGDIESQYDLQDGEEGEWMQMAVDPQDRIWVITRGAPFVSEGDGYAEVAWVDPNSGEHQLALEIPVSFHGGHFAEPHYAGESSAARELGGQGIAIDPNFEENGYVYIMYHPSSENLEEVDNPYHDEIFYANTLVSRFEMADDGTLDPDSEKVVFKVPEQYNTCCHHGCYITFGENREFYISTGDNSNNVGHPTHDWPPDDTVNGLPGATVDTYMGDERQGIVGGRPGPVADAQRSSGNTADKRGKVHRIILNEDGSYDIPNGNLKEIWEAETGESYSDEEFLPEIYVMGMRNPFTISVDEHTGHLWTAHYGNDAGGHSVLGMPGFGSYHLWSEPGNTGYPWFRAYYPYRDYDFETDEVGQPFWPDNLRNNSVNNTGITDIPNVTPALFWHPQSFENLANATEVHPWLDQPRPGENTYPEFEPGGSADVGVVYRYSEDYGQGALDPFFDGKTFIMRPSNSDVTRYVTLNDDGSLEMNEFLPNDDTISGAYDMKVLSDGRLIIMGMYSGIHVVEYQSSGGDSPPGEDDPSGEAIEPGTTIELNGLISGWEGNAPDGISGQTNPTLTLQEGGEYTVTWTNGDGSPHDFALQDADDNNIKKTDIVSEEGATVSLTFTASTEMVEYVCTVHPGTMAGTIDVI
ncbi:plastocyanin/azurin family copper-binding protein [Halomicrococcus sp. NG-SE-24]|uniref:plastocyanin/azurin family copper-binding protein n=1 Tax=Halomicrococcus sp. NG-SE-24 TaxID=3436928 RepID=UPI003D963B26